MRRICLLASLTLVACVGGSSPTNDPALISAQLASGFAQAGMKCREHRPPSMAACEGKQAGDACQAPEDHEGEADEFEPGICKTLRDGRLVCIEVEDERRDDDDECEEHHGSHRDDGHDGDDDDDPICRPRPLAACAGKTAGDACTLTLMDKTIDGICRAFEHDDHDVLVCVPPPVSPPPPPPLVKACTDKAAGDACTIQRDDKTFTGVCHALPSGTLLCLPPPPKPPQEALDACVDHKADDACTFTFKEHQFEGTCRLAPDDKTLVCVPVCRIRNP